MRRRIRVDINLLYERRYNAFLDTIQCCAGACFTLVTGRLQVSVELYNIDSDFYIYFYLLISLKSKL